MWYAPAQNTPNLNHEDQAAFCQNASLHWITKIYSKGPFLSDPGQIVTE